MSKERHLLSVSENRYCTWDVSCVFSRSSLVLLYVAHDSRKLSTASYLITAWCRILQPKSLTFTFWEGLSKYHSYPELSSTGSTRVLPVLSVPAQACLWHKLVVAYCQLVLSPAPVACYLSLGKRSRWQWRPQWWEVYQGRESTG